MISYLLLGGNIGDRVQNLAEASKLLAERSGTVIKESSVYETAAWGKTNQQDFLNQVLAIETTLCPQQLIAAILSIEELMGRKRKNRYDPRIIDIDILLYGNEVIISPNLVIPHPQMAFRRFALVPLAEIAPEINHPVLFKTISELLMECEDQLDVKKI